MWTPTDHWLEITIETLGRWERRRTGGWRDGTGGCDGMDGSGRPTGGERRKENTSAGYKYIYNFFFGLLCPPFSLEKYG